MSIPDLGWAGDHYMSLGRGEWGWRMLPFPNTTESITFPRNTYVVGNRSALAKSHFQDAQCE